MQRPIQFPVEEGIPEMWDRDGPPHIFASRPHLGGALLLQPEIKPSRDFFDIESRKGEPFAWSCERISLARDFAEIGETFLARLSFLSAQK
jgi:hypothetical protein